MSERGFTVFELLIAMAIVTILLTIAVPSFQTFMRSSRLASQANDLIAALSTARAEAMKRRRPVTVCRSSTGANCGGGGGWEAGWIVFVDENSNGTVDGAEVVLLARPALSGKNTLAATANIANRATFNAQGMAPAGLGTFTLCDGKRGGYGRTIAVSITGRTQLKKYDGGLGACT